MNQQAIKLIKIAARIGLTLPEYALASLYEEKAGKISIHKPIIVIGPDRSGTSLVYALLANHLDVCALSAISSMLAEHPLSASFIRRLLTHQAERQYRALPGTNARISGGLTAPREAVHYWFRHLGSHTGGWKNADHDLMTEKDLDDITRRTLPLDLKKRLFVLKKPRLVIKQPGFSLKMRYLNALFPDAIFVHCIRHPVNNFYSLLVQKRENRDPNWGVHIPEWRQYTQLPVEAQTAYQLAGTHDLIQQSLQHLGKLAGRYVPVRYESLTADFAAEVQKLFRGCGLEVPAAILEHPENYIRPGSSLRQSKPLPKDPTAREILEQLAIRMGYPAADTSEPA